MAYKSNFVTQNQDEISFIENFRSMIVVDFFNRRGQTVGVFSCQ